MSLISPIRRPLVSPLGSPLRSGLPWDEAGGGSPADWNADVGGPVVGGKVSAWADQSGLAADLSQGTAAFRGTLYSAGGPNAHNAVEFPVAAGQPTYMTTASMGLGAAVSVCSVVQKPASGRYVCDGGAGNTRAILNNAGDVKMYAGSFGPSLTGLVDGAWFVHVAVFNGASSKATANGGTTATGAVGASTSASHMVSSAAGSAFCLNARLARQIVYSVALSDAQMASIAAYLRAWAAL
jgi:hypothetical protein